ncbi:MAG: hypothetical protein AC479_00535 [miscellaneous Crenarchaeota group-6 archaeon AD8-1]|nr:MAG: hypothetical protein AC479_00535 [miscellaneous Crenarchaeota group-6 archaeon AD8-1]
MQRLGKVISVSPSQNIIIEIKKPNKIGTIVVDENLKMVGKIFDIIGPTVSPYIIIKPTIKKPEKLVGEKVYSIISKKKRRKNNEQR